MKNFVLETRLVAKHFVPETKLLAKHFIIKTKLFMKHFVFERIFLMQYFVFKFKGAGGSVYVILHANAQSYDAISRTSLGSQSKDLFT